MKATVQCFFVVAHIMLYQVVLTFTSVNVTIQMKAIEQYFPVVQFIMLYKVAPAFELILWMKY